jgi:hypothetical protein
MDDEYIKQLLDVKSRLKSIDGQWDFATDLLDFMKANQQENQQLIDWIKDKLKQLIVETELVDAQLAALLIQRGRI